MEWLKSMYEMWKEHPIECGATACVGYAISCIVGLIL